MVTTNMSFLIIIYKWLEYKIKTTNQFILHYNFIQLPLFLMILSEGYKITNNLSQSRSCFLIASLEYFQGLEGARACFLPCNQHLTSPM